MLFSRRAGDVFRANFAPSRILLLALLVVLLIDPWAVLAAGFWLSFGAVGALLYVGAAQVRRPLGWRQQLRA